MLQTIVMVPRAAASLLHCATLAGALFASEAVVFTAAQATGPNPIPTPNLLPPRTFPGETSALFSERELSLLSPYLQHLPTRMLAPELTKNLILAGKMTPERSGVVLDQKHLMFVSWDAQGVVFQKSVFRQPSKSHSGVVALRTKVIASSSDSGELTHSLHQIATVISFLPTSVDAINDNVRVEPQTLIDRRGVNGCNWQGLDFLFKPNNFLPGPSIAVSASRIIPVNDLVYQAAVRRAFVLDNQGRPYHVLSSVSPNQNTENCITAVAGILDHIPGASRLFSTGPLRGQEATDYVARHILAASGVLPNDRGLYDTPQDNWLVGEFLHALPSARTGVLWYSLQRN